MNNNETHSPLNIEKAQLSAHGNVSALISDLKSLSKASVLISNVLPVFAGFWLALYFTNASFIEYWDVFLLTIVGSTMVMAGALILNNWYDADIDSVMERTKNRPTVTGNISLNAALTMGIFLSVLGLILLLFITVEATIYAFVGWFTYVLLYTMWSKRRYPFNTIIGSISGAVTPLIGWSAVISGFHIVPITLFLVLFIWQMPHTFSIAMRRCTEYQAAGVALLPVVYGFALTKRLIVLFISCLLPLPFYLTSLGSTFVVIATLLNVGWLVLGISGFFTKDDLKWAYKIFLYSVNYLTIFFLMVIVVTLPLFN